MKKEENSAWRGIELKRRWSVDQNSKKFPPKTLILEKLGHRPKLTWMKNELWISSGQHDERYDDQY